MAVIPPRPTPPRLPHLGVVGEPAGPAGCQLFNPSPRPHTSLGPPTWASVTRGYVYTRVEEATCTGPPPAITAAEFSALFERCMASGLKAPWLLTTWLGARPSPLRAPYQLQPRTLPQLGGAYAVATAVDGVDVPPPLRVQLRRKHCHLQFLSLRPAGTYLCHLLHHRLSLHLNFCHHLSKESESGGMKQNCLEISRKNGIYFSLPCRVRQRRRRKHHLCHQLWLQH
jgi:hypothetical protein